MKATQWTILLAAKPSSVAQRYADQYPDPNLILHGGKRCGDTLDALRALKCPTKEQVDKIIGNTSWTSVFCGHCSEYRPRVVEVGSTAVCEFCLEDALAGLKAKP